MGQGAVWSEMKRCKETLRSQLMLIREHVSQSLVEVGSTIVFVVTAVNVADFLSCIRSKVHRKFAM